jgi:hypothetical protein
MNDIVKGVNAWLAAHALARLVLVRLVPMLASGALGALVLVGMVPPEAAAACRAALGY